MDDTLSWMLSCVFLCGRGLPRFTAVSEQQLSMLPDQTEADLGGSDRYHVSDQESCWNWNDWTSGTDWYTAGESITTQLISSLPASSVAQL